jgi:glycopeptide antibiotics resistance protein
MVKNKTFLVLVVVYSLVLVKLLVLREGVDHFFTSFTQLNAVQHNLALANFKPGHTIYYYVTLKEPWEVCLQNLAGNILLFMPLGILLCLAFTSSVSKIVLFGALTSLLLELLQVFSGQGVFDVDDILLNALGTLAGAGCYYLAKEIFRKRISAIPSR